MIIERLLKNTEKESIYDEKVYYNLSEFLKQIKKIFAKINSKKGLIDLNNQL